MFANLFYTCKEFRIAIHVLQNQQLRNNHKSKRILMKCFLKKINASVWKSAVEMKWSNISTGQTLDKF